MSKKFQTLTKAGDSIDVVAYMPWLALFPDRIVSIRFIHSQLESSKCHELQSQ